MTTRTRMAALAIAATAFALFGAATGTSAQGGSTPKSPCTYGDARLTLEAPTNAGIPFGSECQYRLYLDGETITFCEGDYILGGIAMFWEYKDLGWSREQAIAEIELNEDRVWIDGVEIPLMYTSFKNGLHPVTGQLLVYQHRAFISQLSVGQHTSYWENFHPDYGLFTSTVHLVVLPRTDAACG